MTAGSLCGSRHRCIDTPPRMRTAHSPKVPVGAPGFVHTPQVLAGGAKSCGSAVFLEYAWLSLAPRDTGTAPELPPPDAARWEATPLKVPSPWNVNAWGNGRDAGAGTARHFKEVPLGAEALKALCLGRNFWQSTASRLWAASSSMWACFSTYRPPEPTICCSMGRRAEGAIQKSRLARWLLKSGLQVLEAWSLAGTVAPRGLSRAQPKRKRAAPTVLTLSRQAPKSRPDAAGGSQADGSSCAPGERASGGST